MYRPASIWSWAFIGIALTQTFCILAFEAYIFGRFQEDLRGNYSSTVQARTIPTFLTLYCFGFFYQLVLVWDALRLKNTIQVLGLVLYNVGLLIYGAVQADQIQEAVRALADLNEIDYSIWEDAKPFMIAIPCILAFTTVLMGIVSWKLYDEFAWTIYKHISADLRMKRRYLTYQVYIALLKFDFFFFLGFTTQFIVIVRDKTDIEFALTIAAIPVTVAILLLAAYFTRKESKAGMIVIIILYIGGLAYFLFKMVRMYEPSREGAYLPARKELTTFAAITILLIVSTIINAIMCMMNFDKGLKPHITGGTRLESDEEKNLAMHDLHHHQGYPGSSSSAGGYGGGGYGGGVGPGLKPSGTRMTID